MRLGLSILLSSFAAQRINSADLFQFGTIISQIKARVPIPDYGGGGCSDSTYGVTQGITCKTECGKLQKVGRGKKVGFVWQMESEDTLIARLQSNKKTKPNPQPKPQSPYIGFLRLDEKYCPDEVLTALEQGIVGLDIGDKYYNDDVVMCSRTRVVNKGDRYKLAGRSSLLYQFKKKSFHEMEIKRDYDVYTVVMSNIADSLSNSSHADYKVLGVWYLRRVAPQASFQS